MTKSKEDYGIGDSVSQANYNQAVKNANDGGGFSDDQIAGETIAGDTSPAPCFIDTSDSNKIKMSDSNNDDRLEFLGFAISDADDTDSISIQTSGVVRGFTGLTKGVKYYVQDAIGTIGSTPGTNKILVGIAISTTEILMVDIKKNVFSKKFEAVDVEWSPFSVLSETIVGISLNFDGLTSGAVSVDVDGTETTYEENINFLVAPSTNLALTSQSLGWKDINGASYDSKSFSVSSQETNSRCIHFSSDGTKMYTVGVNNDTVYQYTLSTPWDVSSASYSSKSFSVNSQDSLPVHLFFKPDGTKMYMLGLNSNTVYQYSLSTAWDVSTASYDLTSKGVSPQDSDVRGIFFKDDGTKMYMLGNNTNTAYQYTLSTPWVVSSASYDSKSFSVASQEGTPYGIFFKDDGTKMYICGNDVNQYTLSTAWDVSTASYDNNIVIGGLDSNPIGLFFKPDGTKMYVHGNSTNSVYQFSTEDAYSGDILAQIITD